MMHLVFMESEMVRKYYTYKAEIDLSIKARRTAELTLSKYIDEFNSSTLPDEMYVLDQYIKEISDSIETHNSRIVWLKSKKKELKKELKSLGIKVK